MNNALCAQSIPSQIARKTLRIALFHNSQHGGTKRAIYQLAKGLVARGHRIDVFVPTTADEQYLPLRSLGLHMRQIATRPFQPRAWRPYLAEVWIEGARRRRSVGQEATLGRRLAREIDAGGYDVVWVDKFAVAPAALRFLKSPTVYFCHEPTRKGHEHVTRAAVPAAAPPPSRLTRLYRHTCLISQEAEARYLMKIDRRNAASADRIVSNSRYMSAYIQDTYGRSASISYLGVDTAVFRPLGLPREHLVLSVGWLSQRGTGKRHHLIIEAISQIPPAQRPRLVIIAGSQKEPYATELRNLADQMGVALQLCFDVSDEALVEWYNRAAAVGYTALHEPFGLVALEAMACGTPVVAVREGGLQESVQDGTTGFLVEATPEAVAAALKQLLDNPERQRRMGQAGIALVQQRWTWQAAVERFERHLYEVSAANL